MRNLLISFPIAVFVGYLFYAWAIATLPNPNPFIGGYVFVAIFTMAANILTGFLKKEDMI